MHTSAFQTIENLHPGDHLCCIYRSEDEHREVFTPFVKQGLQQAQRVIYIVDAHTAETVTAYLRAAEFDVETYLQSGQLKLLTSNETYTSGGSFDPDGMIELLRRETEEALAEGYHALRVTGEMT